MGTGEKAGDTSVRRFGVRAGAIALLLAIPLPGPFSGSPLRAEGLATDLGPAAETGFSRYVAATEARIQREVSRTEGFLYIDTLPAAERSEVQAELRRGEIFMQPLITRDSNGHEIDAPGGMIHHWIGAAFIPGATIPGVFSVVEDYDHHARIYSPEITRSRLISRRGNDFTIFYRLRKHKVITVTLDTEHAIHYARLDDTHWWSESHSTRIAEVADAGKPDEHEKPPGHDSGFLWRMNSYWRFVQRDGGVYIECESISLSRDVPTGLGWLVGPIVDSIPRESLEFTMATTRDAVEQYGSQKAASR